MPQLKCCLGPLASKAVAFLGSWLQCALVTPSAQGTLASSPMVRPPFTTRNLRRARLPSAGCSLSPLSLQSSSPVYDHIGKAHHHHLCGMSNRMVEQRQGGSGSGGGGSGSSGVGGAALGDRCDRPPLQRWNAQLTRIQQPPSRAVGLSRLTLPALPALHPPPRSLQPPNRALHPPPPLGRRQSR